MAGSLSKDGRKYADRSKSSIISYLLHENSDSYRRQLELKGIKPKNHHKHNLKHIAQIQKATKQQKENDIKRQNVKNKKSSKYSKVDSKLKKILTSTPLSSSNKKNTNFMLRNRSNIQSQSSLNASSIKQQRIKNKRKPAVPKQSEMSTSISKSKNVEKKDYISLNKKRQQISNRNNENDDKRFVNRKGYGKVPEYLIKRKLEEEELEQKKMEEAELSKIPAGMRIMEADERLETLEVLNVNKQEIIEAIKHLPLVIETPSMKRHEAELHKKLNEIENTIKLFQKPTVFVAMDD